MDDDGYFVILGRRHELWMNDQMRPVFPRDVEEVINELPEVSEVAVVAVANKPTAFIRLHPGEQLSVEAVFEFCRKRLPPGYAPRQVFFVDELPRDYLGKILKDELANRYG
jgi:acyl-CoA synthetase (AMP-forming)/AMP-acid ligase II